MGDTDENSPAAMEDFVAAEVRERDRERWLSVLWAPAGKRLALLACHAYDLELQRAVAAVEDPMLAEIRLAWWREQLEGLCKGGTPERQPLLDALAGMRDEGIDLSPLMQLEEGLLPLLGEGDVNLVAVSQRRGRALFGVLGNVLGVAPEGTGEAGEIWGVSRLLREAWGHRSPRTDRVDPQSLPVPSVARGRLPKPLAILARLAADDVVRARAGRPLRPAAGVRRVWRMLFTAGV